MGYLDYQQIYKIAWYNMIYGDCYNISKQMEGNNSINQVSTIGYRGWYSDIYLSWIKLKSLDVQPFVYSIGTQSKKKGG